MENVLGNVFDRTGGWQDIVDLGEDGDEDLDACVPIEDGEEAEEDGKTGGGHDDDYAARAADFGF